MVIASRSFKESGEVTISPIGEFSRVTSRIIG